MARAKKLWRPLKVLRRHEWVPFATAWARAEPVAGPGSHTRYELQQAFRSGQLVAAVQFIAGAGAETWIVLERECWRYLLIQHAWAISEWKTIPGWWEAEGGTQARQGGRRHVLVHRRELDKHYPAAAVPSNQDTTRRPPGPRFLTKHDWHTIDGVIGRLCHNDQERLAVPPNEANLIRAVAQYCVDHDLPPPVDSEIAIAVQRVCAVLRAPRPAIDVFRSVPRRRPPSKK
jgi:hypothetical protein